MSIGDRLIAVCEQQSGREAHLSSHLVDDLDLDSLDRIELAMIVEETFNVEITDDEVDNPSLCTVQALVDLVEAKLAA